MSDFKCLDIKATQTKFAQLVGCSQQAISDRVHRGTLKDGGTLLQWLLQYTDALREEAAGRSGEDQASLTKARTEESQLKTAKMRVEYLRDIGSVVSAIDAADVLAEWSRQANQDYTQGFHTLVSEIQNKHGITVDRELVENIVFTTAERIKDHAEKLGRNLVESIDDIQQTQTAINS